MSKVFRRNPPAWELAVAALIAIGIAGVCSLFLVNARADEVTPRRPVTAARGPAPLAGEDARMRAGGAIYSDTCMACHKSSGLGIDLLFPKLSGNLNVQQRDPTSLILVVLQGGRLAATDAAPTGPAMPSLGWRLSNAQVADVLTYIRNSWGNAASPVSAADVESFRKRL